MRAWYWFHIYVYNISGTLLLQPHPDIHILEQVPDKTMSTGVFLWPPTGFRGWKTRNRLPGDVSSFMYTAWTWRTVIGTKLGCASLTQIRTVFTGLKLPLWHIMTSCKEVVRLTLLVTHSSWGARTGSSFSLKLVNSKIVLQAWTPVVTSAVWVGDASCRPQVAQLSVQTCLWTRHLPCLWQDFKELQQ